MSHFLGFFIDDLTRKKVVHQVGKISKVFSDMGIQVRWIKPSDYHIKFQNLSSNLGIFKKLYISYKLKNILQKPIKVSLGNIKLGTSRNLKGLVYIEIEEGGEILRDLRYRMNKTLKIKDNVQFIPHIAIGRINKDLSRQEVSNILRDIDNVSKGIKIDNREFLINEIDLVRIKYNNYQILKKFLTCS